MTNGPLFLQPDSAIAGLLGLLVGGAIGLVVAVGLVVYFVRKSKTAPTSTSAPCPRCGETSTRPVAYTLWGGALGPKLLHHVECSRCSHRFNGRTGQDNTVGIAIYLASTFVIAGGIAFALVIGGS